MKIFHAETHVKLLFLVKNFHREWGGGPESVRLMARRLKGYGVTSDVFDGGKLHRAIENMDVLPRKDVAVDSFELNSLESYNAILQVGPWQSFWATHRIVSRIQIRQRYFYLPRGGLADIDFRGRRGIKKMPYFPLFEQRFVDRADGIIFSSVTEQNGSRRLRRSAAKGIVIPDFFEPLPTVAKATEAGAFGDAGGRARKIRFGFMAEIRPLKGLAPFIDGYLDWVKSRRMGGQASLIVGGAPRAGSHAYLRRIMQKCTDVGPEVDVIFAGNIDQDKRSDFYSTIDVFVAPSRFESYGLTVLEAISAGCAVVAAPDIGVLERLPGGNGVVVLESLAPDDVARGLDQSLRVIQSGQTQIAAEAQNSVAAINRIATERWRTLIGF